jgi:hypothetical protein
MFKQAVGIDKFFLLDWRENFRNPPFLFNLIWYLEPLSFCIYYENHWMEPGLFVWRTELFGSEREELWTPIILLRNMSVQDLGKQSRSGLMYSQGNGPAVLVSSSPAACAAAN